MTTQSQSHTRRAHGALEYPDAALVALLDHEVDGPPVPVYSAPRYPGDGVRPSCGLDWSQGAHRVQLLDTPADYPVAVDHGHGAGGLWLRVMVPTLARGRGWVRLVDGALAVAAA